MGNKWSASPSFTSEIVNDDDGEPPDEAAAAGESTLTVTFIESKNLNLNSVLGSGKHNALIRVLNSFNEQSFTKPMKFDQNTWYMPKRRFVFSSNDPDGEIRVSLLQNHLPPLPAVPSTENLDCCLRSSSGHGKEKLVLAKMVIPVSLVELKQAKRVDRWITVEAPGLSNLVTGEVPQVRISLDFNYRPSRIVDSVDSLNRKYDIEDTLGAGVSVVKKAVQKHTKKAYAVKYLQKTVKGQNIPRSTLDNEIEILKTVYHPNIVQLYETMEDPSTIYLIMELVKGSDLFDISDVLGTLRPASVLALLTPLLNALSYLHSRGIVHHDIKPENIIVDYSQNTLKLTDFGSAKFSTKSQEGAFGGTLNYMAPEVLMNMRGARNVCGQAVDVWSIGVLTYLLIAGVHPFDSGKSHENILNRIIAGKFDFKQPVWEKVPKECKDFVKRCLVIDPKKRATVSELLKHAWIAKGQAAKESAMFTKEECERIVKEKSSQSTSRSNSMGSLLELFSNEGVSRS
jgi:tRNA A-37 threonylcarbamoyl transferase component Bud32